MQARHRGAFGGPEIFASRSVRRIRKLGKINFLGPEDTAGRLVRLKLEDWQALDDQLDTLVEDIKKY